MRHRMLFVLIALAATTLYAGEWESLFNGRDLAGWVTGKGGASTNWVVEDGVLHRKSGGGDIVTTKEYSDFELEFEWKISEKGNSGIKYRFYNNYGPEYQVLDDKGHSNGKDPFTSAASMYLIAKPDAEKELKPVGEFNTGKIIAKGSHIEHWLNGRKVLEMEVGSEEWNQRKNGSKFKKVKDFGTGSGKILLQDHGDLVWYRNIRIREIKD